MEAYSEDYLGQFQKYLEVTWQEIFGFALPYSLAEFEAKFCNDIHLPVRKTCSVTGKPTYSMRQHSRPISQEAVMARSAKDDFLLPRRDISSVQDMLQYAKEVNFTGCDTVINSDLTFESDVIHSSERIYKSSMMFISKIVGLSYNCRSVEYAFACADSTECNFVIRAILSKGLSSCFHAINSAKCANCFFIENSINLRDCIFCFHLNSKQYCVANMQFTKEEYLNIKKMFLGSFMDSYEAMLACSS